jgi:hypothetical protein
MDYFEVCWSIFSTICLVNVVFGVLVCEITTFTVLAAVPIFSSAAGAIANGLCYYVYYIENPVVNEVVAAVFSDFFCCKKQACCSTVISSSNESFGRANGASSPGSFGH